MYYKFGPFYQNQTVCEYFKRVNQGQIKAVKCPNRRQETYSAIVKVNKATWLIN